MRLKDKLRELRTGRDLTLKNLAETTGLSVSYLSDIERGRTNPSLKTVEALADALDVSVQTLLTGVEFIEETSHDDLPEGLKELVNDEEFNEEINRDWIDLLSKIQMRGKRPQSKREWMELYLHLRSLLEK
ncbi:MAG: helix-turn-helix domain-containing protein [Anaerolineae bacterium]|jgi:XRE family transcriptional regulator, regulator of sulfur utilization|nr:helix-turn-helix domain-containing protein [Anaerolineae bacterium]